MACSSFPCCGYSPNSLWLSACRPTCKLSALCLADDPSTAPARPAPFPCDLQAWLTQQPVISVAGIQLARRQHANCLTNGSHGRASTALCFCPRTCQHSSHATATLCKQLPADPYDLQPRLTLHTLGCLHASPPAWSGTRVALSSAASSQVQPASADCQRPLRPCSTQACPSQPLLLAPNGSRLAPACLRLVPSSPWLVSCQLELHQVAHSWSNQTSPYCLAEATSSSYSCSLPPIVCQLPHASSTTHVL